MREGAYLFIHGCPRQFGSGVREGRTALQRLLIVEACCGVGLGKPAPRDLLQERRAGSLVHGARSWGWC